GGPRELLPGSPAAPGSPPVSRTRLLRDRGLFIPRDEAPTTVPPQLTKGRRKGRAAIRQTIERALQGAPNSELFVSALNMLHQLLSRPHTIPQAARRPKLG